jgi:acetyltransferase-like isoleucine patch superfamily enzyme
MGNMIHPLSDVHSPDIGCNTKIWQFCVVLGGAKIGNNCTICANVFIENDVRIGNDVTVKSGVQLWDGVYLEDGVFIGPNVTFTNDLTPRSKQYPVSFLKTILKRGSSIGANSVIIAGRTIGEYAFVGAGSVVTKDIPPYTVWYGNPARQRGFITETGVLLDENRCDKNGVKLSPPPRIESRYRTLFKEKLIFYLLKRPYYACINTHHYKGRNKISLFVRYVWYRYHLNITQIKHHRNNKLFR